MSQQSPFRAWLILQLTRGFQLSHVEAEAAADVLSDATTMDEVYHYAETLPGTQENRESFAAALMEKLFPGALAEAGLHSKGQSGSTSSSSSGVTLSLRELRQALKESGGSLPVVGSSAKEKKASAASAKKTAKQRTISKNTLLQWNPYDIDEVVGGREVCDCQARKHAFVGNCIACGRIVCSREKAGPCPVCGTLVLDMRSGDQLPAELMVDPAFRDALARRDRLLKGDVSDGSAAKVIDDESDYFSISSSAWRSDEEKKQALEREERREREAEDQRRARYMTLDLATGAVDVVKVATGEERMLQVHSYDEPWASYIRDGLLKIQPNEENMMLSMHQPWASLLVYNVKKVEGRSWSTPYRGWVWITSTATVCDAAVVDSVLETYRSLCGDEAVNRVPFLPSRLVGCAYLEDVLSLEDYRRTRDQSLLESDAPFVWCFSEERRFVVRNPPSILGKPKLWTMSGQALLGMLQHTELIRWDLIESSK